MSAVLQSSRRAASPGCGVRIASGSARGSCASRFSASASTTSGLSLSNTCANIARAHSSWPGRGRSPPPWPCPAVPAAHRHLQAHGSSPREAGPATGRRDRAGWPGSTVPRRHAVPLRPPSRWPHRCHGCRRRTARARIRPCGYWHDAAAAVPASEPGSSALRRVTRAAMRPWVAAAAPTPSARNDPAHRRYTARDAAR